MISDSTSDVSSSGWYSWVASHCSSAAWDFMEASWGKNLGLYIYMYRGTTFCKIEPPPQDNYSKAYQSKTSNHYAKETTLLILLCSAKEMLEDASMLGRIDRDLEPDTLSNQLSYALCWLPPTNCQRFVESLCYTTLSPAGPIRLSSSRACTKKGWAPPARPPQPHRPAQRPRGPATAYQDKKTMTVDSI